MIRKLTDDEYKELMERKQSLEKRSYNLRTRLGIVTKVTHGQKMPKEIHTSPYYKELLEKKQELAEINKKLAGQGRGSAPPKLLAAKDAEIARLQAENDRLVRMLAREMMSNEGRVLAERLQDEIVSVYVQRIREELRGNGGKTMENERWRNT